MNAIHWVVGLFFIHLSAMIRTTWYSYTYIWTYIPFQVKVYHFLNPWNKRRRWHQWHLYDYRYVWTLVFSLYIRNLTQKDSCVYIILNFLFIIWFTVLTFLMKFPVIPCNILFTYLRLACLWNSFVFLPGRERKVESNIKFITCVVANNEIIQKYAIDTRCYIAKS